MRFTLTRSSRRPPEIAGAFKDGRRWSIDLDTLEQLADFSVLATKEDRCGGVMIQPRVLGNPALGFHLEIIDDYGDE